MKPSDGSRVSDTGALATTLNPPAALVNATLYRNTSHFKPVMIDNENIFWVSRLRLRSIRRQNTKMQLMLYHNVHIHYLHVFLNINHLFYTLLPHLA
jgi:hypothetical protein